MRPHRRPPARPPHPWDSSGKNTGVGCRIPSPMHESESEAIQLCPTLSDPMDATLGAFPRSQFFASGGQSIRASASASVLPMTNFLQNGLV